MPAQEVTSQTQERLDTNAARATEQLTDKLLAPLNSTLSTLEGVFPGITERMTATIDPAKLRTALSVDVAQSIKAMMEAGTEGSLTAALSKVKELRSLVQSGGRAEIAEAKELMGNKMVGPDARIFEGKALGVIPALPANIMEILNSKCELSNDGRTVAQTHRLALLPASIDGVPTTVNSLRQFDADARKGKDSSFYNQDWYDNEAFANKPLEESVWVLLHETVAPGTLNKTDPQQVKRIEKLTNHETAKAIALIGTMVVQYRENGEKLFPDVYGRCEDRSASGARVFAGNFLAGGLGVGARDDFRYVDLGRAVVRKLNT
jgi:hypothetical protein